MADSSYWIYIMHLPVVKFLTACLVTGALGIVTYRYLVRYTPLGTLLNGKRTSNLSGRGPQWCNIMNLQDSKEAVAPSMRPSYRYILGNGVSGRRCVLRIKSLPWVVLGLTVVAALALSIGCGESATATPFSMSDQSDQATTTEAEPTAMAMEAEDTSVDEMVAADSSAEGSVEETEVTVQLASFAQNRIIVHTGSISMVVENVADTVSRITDVSSNLGGWVVSSNRVSRHSGAIAIRVPAGSLTEAFRRIEALALEVESREVTSQDVTDEFVDSESRLVSLRATKQRLLSFLNQAGEIEDALLVEKELSALELRIEEMQGRINYLGQTSAFSLIEVSLKVSPVKIDVDPGPDVSLRVGESGSFRASFRAPPGIPGYSFVWDFGDGTTVQATGSTPRPDGTRVTATVTHTYSDDRDSPYLVKVDLTGTGTGGIAEGTAIIEATVRQVPTIEVFAGENLTVEEGDNVDYTVRFTRPAELWDYEYQWDFGDGSPTVAGSPEEGAGRADVSHKFSDYRPKPYDVVVTVSAMSEVGRVSSSDSFIVDVTEVQGFVVGGWDVGETAKTAVRALSAIGKVVLTVVIWVGIFSPVIIVIVGAIILFNRYGARIRSLVPSAPSRPRPQFRPPNMDPTPSAAPPADSGAPSGEGTGPSQSATPPPSGETEQGKEPSNPDSPKEPRA